MQVHDKATKTYEISLQTSIAICNRKLPEISSNFCGFLRKTLILPEEWPRSFVRLLLNKLAKVSFQVDLLWDWVSIMETLSKQFRHLIFYWTQAFLEFQPFWVKFLCPTLEQRASVLWFELTLCSVFAKFVVVLITRAAPALSQWTQLVPADIAVNKLGCPGGRWDKLNTSAVPTLTELQDCKSRLGFYDACFFRFASFEMKS
jgi:hypothetical protein